MTLAHQILSLLDSEGALKASEIAERLGVEKSAVNGALYGELTRKVRQDKAYRWYLPDQSPTPTRRAPAEPSGLLARLCDYYLACLAQDDLGGVSLWLLRNCRIILGVFDDGEGPQESECER